MKLFDQRHQTYVHAFQPADAVKLVQSGQEYFDVLVDLIRKAKRSIHLHTYIFANDDIGKTISDELISAAERGVDVSVVMDGYGSLGFSSKLFQEWKTKRIQAHFFSRISIFKNLNLGRRLHHKICVVDDFRALVGGINIADKYRGTMNEAAWLDFAIFIEGEVCNELKRICGQIEERQFPVFKPSPNRKYHGQNIPQINIRQNDWLRNRNQIHYSYLMAFEKAERSIYLVASYFLPGRKLRKSLERAAARGVKIKIILAGKSDIPTILNASLYLYRWLLRNKIEIYEWQKSVLHGKLAIVDNEWMTIGSFNLNLLSTYASIELNIDIEDKDLAKSSTDLLNRLISEGCTQIDTQRHRTVFDRIYEFIAYLAGRTLIRWITFFPGVRKRIR